MKHAAPEERPAVARAKLFMNGRSQAVRLPREFRFDGDEVAIRRKGTHCAPSPSVNAICSLPPSRSRTI